MTDTVELIDTYTDRILQWLDSYYATEIIAKFNEGRL